MGLSKQALLIKYLLTHIQKTKADKESDSLSAFLYLKLPSLKLSYKITALTHDLDH